MDDVVQWRSLFPITADRVYLYHGGISPCSLAVREAVTEAIETWQKGGVELWEQGYHVFHELRQRSVEPGIRGRPVDVPRLARPHGRAETIAR